LLIERIAAMMRSASSRSNDQRDNVGQQKTKKKISSSLCVCAALHFAAENLQATPLVEDGFI